MNNKFDEMTRGMAQSVTRRQALKKFSFGLAGMALAWVATIAIVVCAGTANAQLIYSFETGTPANPDGFGPNGGGATISQDTFGATDGLHSMRYSVVSGATFVGALTSVLPPSLNNPPGVTGIMFDLTIGPNDVFTGAFNVLGITVFGANAPLGQFGLQAQFAPLIHVEGKAAGTYLNQVITLTGATNPLNFTPNQTFDQIFTSGVPGPNQMNPTGFEIFLNKSNDAASTVYIDNIRIIPVPEPSTTALIGLGLVGLMLRVRRR